jgi:hypothetical protein
MRGFREMCAKRVQSLRDRWQAVDRAILLARPRIQGEFFWSFKEDVSIARYVDCTCRAVRTVLENAIKHRGKALAPDTPRKAAQDIYEWLRREYDIHYDFELAAPARNDQRIRKHSEALSRATCVELATLFAALLEGCHKRPVLVHYLERSSPDPQDWWAHVACGVWLSDLCYCRHPVPPGPCAHFSGDGLICNDGTALQGHIRAGRLLMLECIGFSKGDKAQYPVDMPFDSSRRKSMRGSARTNGRNDALGGKPFNFAVDIERCRGYGVAPISQDV